MPRPPLVAVIGKKHSGKTTLAVQLSAILGRRGHRVMSIKHGSHTFNIDPDTTDTYRHYHEGEVAKVAMVAPDKFALVERWSEELGPETIAERYMSDADIVICEGFKRSALPKIEIFRASVYDAPLFDAGAPEADKYLAIVTDVDEYEAPCHVVRLSDPGWLDQLATIVEREVMTS